MDRPLARIDQLPSADLIAYAGMFWTALLAATVLPGVSEVLFVSLLVSETGNPWVVLGCATAGNTLGSVVNWACGRFLGHYRDRRWFPVSPCRLDRWSGLFQRYGLISLLFAWAPVVGDVLTVTAGILRVPILPFATLVGIGKLMRYLAVAGGMLLWTGS